MIYEFTIPGRLPGLNEYIEAERGHRQKAAKLKADYERMISRCIRTKLGMVRITVPVRIDYHFFERDRRRDKSNVSGYARKLIEDSLVKCGVLRNDGWKEIDDYKDHFAVDKARPRIEVTITEVDQRRNDEGKRISDGAAPLERGCDGGRGTDRVDARGCGADDRAAVSRSGRRKP